MELLKSTIAEKIKTLNFFIPLLREENEKPVSQLDIDIMLETLKDLYLDMLNLSESITNKRLIDLTAIPDMISETSSVKEIETTFLQEEKEVPQEVFESKNEGGSIKMVFESTTLENEEAEPKKQQETASRTIGEINAQITLENLEPATENFVDKVKSYVRDVFEKSVTEDRNLVENTADGEKADADFDSQKVHDTIKEETIGKVSISISEMPLPEKETIETQETPSEQESGAAKTETAKEISVLEYLKSMKTEDVSKNLTNRFEPNSSPQKSQTIADKFTQDKGSVFEKISSQNNNQDINFKLQQQVVSDLRNIIGLNEKFLFIQKLFLSDSVAYTEFISQLNNTQTIEEMEACLMKENQERSWEEKAPEVYFDLLKLVGRKFV